MIAVMQPAPERKRTIWAFWAAVPVAAAGGVAPLLLAGTSGRASGVIFPFGFAAVALAACAVLEPRGRLLTTVLYLVAGLAIVFGVLAMFALLIQMSVLSPCPPAPAPCGLGYARPLSSSESTGIDYAIVLGLLAIVLGFGGLVANYRQHRAQPTSFAPPSRRVPAQPAHQPDEPSAPDEQSAPSTSEGAAE
jgi:hypothetical protein